MKNLTLLRQWYYLPEQKELDSHIYGYVEGSLNIWTGLTGSGKSTYIIGSCINESINNGYNTFIYSGELTKSQLKNWVILQLAGREILLNGIMEKINLKHIQLHMKHSATIEENI